MDKSSSIWRWATLVRQRAGRRPDHLVSVDSHRPGTVTRINARPRAGASGTIAARGNVATRGSMAVAGSVATAGSIIVGYALVAALFPPLTAQAAVAVLVPGVLL
ncbi:MAG: hypothetical protein M3460_21255, partial [Actinomycetota bacterium]|nr:hypothetical protein [Actinomycetota bacterium]